MNQSLIGVVVLLCSCIGAAEEKYTFKRSNPLEAKVTNGSFLKVCDNGFTIQAATVICRVNTSDTSHVHITIKREGQGQGGVVPVQNSCDGSEKTFKECYVGKEGICRNGYVQIHCKARDHILNPAFALDKSDIRGYKDSRVTVTCSVTSNRTYNNYWYKWTLGEKEIGSSPSVTLTLTNENDNKTLRCGIYYRNEGIGNATAKLTVYYPPPPMEHYTVSVMTGSNLHLVNFSTDHAISKPLPQYQWGRVYQISKLKRGEPELKDIKTTDSGRYIVYMTNQMDVTEGQDRTGHGVRLVQVNVIEKPAVCVESIFVLKDETVSIACANTNSSFRPDVTWFQDGKNIATNNTMMIEGDRKVNATYTCSFQYSNISAEGVPDVKINYTCNTTIYTLDQPEYTLMAHEGNAVTPEFFNMADQTDKKWTKLIKGVLENVTQGGFPNITKVKKDDSGVYIALNNMSESYRLKVMYEPNVTCQSKVSVERGTSRTITCIVDASPQANVTWTRSLSNVSLPDGDSYTIVDASDDDAGVYVCTANNTMNDSSGEVKDGSSTCEIRVVVYESGDVLTLAIVCGVFGTVVLGLIAAVVFLTKKAYFGRARSDSGISLPMKSTPAPPAAKTAPSKRSLPNTPALPPPPGPTMDDQQDFYENT